MSEHSPRRAVILLSGGLDSATAGAVARRDGFELYALTVRYGQRHAAELDAAAKVAEALGVRRHVTVPVDLSVIGGSALTGGIDVPKNRSTEARDAEIPVTYVPARNTILLSLALGYAEVLEAADIFIGANAVDYSGYPDCRKAFLDAFALLANVATKAAVEGRLSFRIHAPLLELTKARIIRLGTELGVDYGLTHSCYDPLEDGTACGRCDACLLRRGGFAKAGLTDPISYAVAGE